jgi:hypothetical protein
VGVVGVKRRQHHEQWQGEFNLNPLNLREELVEPQLDFLHLQLLSMPV